jgi:DNA-binding transcriptional LysR family regulator
VDIDQLRTFLEVVEHGSFSRAAQSLHVTQSTVSFRIKGIERATACRLLDRKGPLIRPTRAGRVLHGYASKMLALESEMLGQLKNDGGAARGLVSIVASTIPAEYLLPPILVRFRTAHPGITVRVNVVDSGKAIALLRAGGYDFALAGAASKDTQLVFTPFAEDQIVLVGPCPNPFVGKGGLAPGQLAKIPLLVRELGSGTRDAVGPILAREGMLLGGESPSIEIASTEAIKRCVLQGAGLAFLSMRAVREEIAAHRLCLVPLAGLPVHRRFFLAHARGQLSAPAKALSAAIIGKGD